MLRFERRLGVLRQAEKGAGGGKGRQKDKTGQSNRGKSKKPDYRILYKQQERINVSGILFNAQVIRLKDGRVFAYGPDPIDGKTSWFRGGPIGWTRVSNKYAATLTTKLHEANPTIPLM
jgi:hypothetical protein